MRRQSKWRKPLLKTGRNTGVRIFWPLLISGQIEEALGRLVDPVQVWNLTVFVDGSIGDCFDIRHRLPEHCFGRNYILSECRSTETGQQPRSQYFSSYNLRWRRGDYLASSESLPCMHSASESSGHLWTEIHLDRRPISIALTGCGRPMIMTRAELRDLITISWSLPASACFNE
jgi:hypothetical protein